MIVDPIRSAGGRQTQAAGTQTAELFEQHSRMVYGLCRALLRDPDDADDATQATFVSAYTSLLGGGEVREPAAWLATIARNECAGRARARMREPLPLLDADLGHTKGPEAELERKAVVEELQNAISELPEKQREAVVLRDLYGLHYTEVSAALGMSIASVESLLFRARRSLRVSLKPLASGALVVPVAIRQGIAQALPCFTTAGGAGGEAASGAVGLGLLAKFTGVPVALKIAAGVAVVTATGSVAVVGAEHAAKPHPTTPQAVSRPQSAGANDQTASGPAAGVFVPVLDRRGTSAAGVDGSTDHADGGEPGSGSGENRRAIPGGPTGGSELEVSDSDRSARTGRADDTGSSGARVDDHIGARKSLRSGDGDGKSGFTGSRDESGSGELKVPETGDELLDTHPSSSGSSTSDGVAPSDDSGASADSEIPDDSSSSDDSHPDEPNEPSDDSADTVTPSPPA